MSVHLQAFVFTEAQRYILASACEIEAQTLEQIGADGNQAAAKWAAMLRDLQRVLEVPGGCHE